MKSASLMFFCAVMALCSHAFASLKPQVVIAEKMQQSGGGELSAEEIAFAAKLSDENRRSFVSRLSEAQRHSVMIAFQNGADANEAVRNRLTAEELKNHEAIASSEQ